MAPEEMDPTRTVMLTISTLRAPFYTYQRSSESALANELRAQHAADERADEGQRQAADSGYRFRLEANETARAARRALMSARIDLRQNVQGVLEEITEGIDSLTMRSARVPAYVRPDFRRVLRELEASRASVERDLHELMPSTLGELQRMKRGLEMRLGELKHAVQQAESRI